MSPYPIRPIGKEYTPPRHHVVRWIILAVVIAAALTAFYVFFLKPVPAPSVSIQFTKPDHVQVGNPFVLNISLSNDSAIVLDNATLSILLPDNVSFEGMASDQRAMDQSLGDLGPGSINPEDFNLIVTGDPNSVANITAKLTYTTAISPNTQFESDGAVDVVVGGPAFSVSFTTPASIFNGQSFQIVVNYANTTGDSFDGIQLAVQYPPGFAFGSASPVPQTSADDTWNLGTVPANATGTITITGTLTGPSAAAYVFVGNLTGGFMGETYALDDETANVAIASSPLSVSIAPNNNPGYVAGLDDTLDYVLTYTNTANVAFQNINLRAALVGAMFDFSTLNTAGSFNSVNDTVTWNAANTPALTSLAPGASGSVDFKVNTKNAFPIRLLSDKNYTLAVNARIQSATVPPGTDASATVSVASVQNKVGGAIAIGAEGYWRDAESGILNAGPYPPKVNQATQYTIHWDITNYSTDAENVTVSAALQSGTTCTGTATSSVATAPVCDPTSGLVTWTIPEIPATTGVTGPPAEAVFQVTNTPAVNQVGQSVTLMGPTTLQATDVFTSSTLRAAAPAVTTDIPNDATISSATNRQVSE